MEFLPPLNAFSLAFEADPQLTQESFLRQVRRYIAQGQLRASGRCFNGKRFVSLGFEDKYLSSERTEIPPEAMADYDGPGFNGQIIRENGNCVDGWADVRLPADDVARLWPHEIAAAVPIKRRPRGPKPRLRDGVKDRMENYCLEHSLDELKSMKGLGMASLFGASRNTCEAARKIVLSKLSEF